VKHREGRRLTLTTQGKMHFKLQIKDVWMDNIDIFCGLSLEGDCWIGSNLFSRIKYHFNELLLSSWPFVDK